MRDYRSLETWQQADSLVLAIYRITTQFPSDERFGLATQMRRAAVSVASNIAEAAGLGSNAAGRRHLSIAAGSASELEHQMDLATRLGYVGNEAPELIEELARLKKMLRALRHRWRGTNAQSPTTNA